MAHAQPNSTLQESEITDNIDDLEGEDVFNLKFPMSPMSNSELEQFLQQLDDLIEKLCIKDNKVTEWEEISREGEEADEIILRQGYFFRETITLLPMQRPVLYAMYNAIYDAWLTYRNYHIYLHLLDADSDYDIKDNYMHFINDDCDENSDNDEGSDSHEGIESLDCNCRCRHYSVDNNTEDEHSENEVSDGYKDDDTGDEHSENAVCDIEHDIEHEHSGYETSGWSNDSDYETSDWSN